MFLSALVSQYETDGSLVVDLGEESGPLLRFGPYAQGMPWFRWSQKRWRETALDWGAQIVNSAHETRRDLPVLRYLQSWPGDLVQGLRSIFYSQSTVMQICARYPAARDLARTNLTLLWLVAARYSADPVWRSRFPEVLALRQRDLLAAFLNQPDVRPAQARFLNKLVLMDGDKRTLRWIRTAVASEELVMAFRHWRRVPSSYLPLLSGPLLRRLAWLRDGLASTDNTWVFGKIVSEHLDLLSDTSRMLAQLEGAIGHATDDLVSCASPSWDGLQQLHDALLDYWLHRGPPSTSGNAAVDPALVFGPPPIPSNARFQAITNVAQLEEEGQLMKHCVATRAPDILAGQCYIYRVSVCGERGTLQVGIRPGGLVIEEFRLRNNANPSPSAWRVAQGWISRYTPKS